MLIKIQVKFFGFLGKLRRNVRFIKQFYKFNRESLRVGRKLPMLWGQRRVFLYDDTESTGFDRHYVYHTAWAARIIADTKPACHIDISSTLYFCTTVSAFVPVHYYDYRPACLKLENLSSEYADLNALPFADNSVYSLSCMHVVEHVGLGRYGDPLNPVGDLKAIAELVRVLAPGGHLLFVVPVGQPRILFNAHRIYAYSDIIKSFEKLELVQFALVPDDQKAGGLIMNATADVVDSQLYGCGCFWFKKK